MKPRRAAFSLAGFTAFVTFALGDRLMALSITWDGDTGTTWADGANWTGGNAPATDITTDTAIFNAATTFQPNLAANRSVTGINFTGNTGTLNWTLSGSTGVALTLGGGGIDSTGLRDGTVTISVPTLIMGSTAATVWSIFDNSASLSTNSVFTVNSNIQVNATAQLDLLANRASSGTGSGVVNLNGVISGTTAGGVRFRGANSSRNTFNLGTSNTYSGTTTIAQVNVNFTSLADSASASSFGQSGTVILGDNASAAAASYTGAGSGGTDRLWTINGTGGASLNNNSNNLTGGALSFNHTGAITAGTAGNRSLTLGGSYAGGTNTLAGLVSNMTGFTTSLTKSGAAIWKLSNTSNSFSGTITAVGGELQMDTLPDGGVIAYNGGVVSHTGATDDTSNRLLQIGTVGGNITAVLRSSGAGALDMTNTGAVTNGGALTTGAGVRLGGTNTGDNYFRSSLGDLNSVAIKFEKADAGKWILTHTNTFTGGVTLSGGTLGFNANAALGATAGAINITQNANMVATGDATLGSGRTITVSSTRTASFGITSAAGTLLVIDSKITGIGGNVSRVSGSAFSTGVVRYANDANDFTGTFGTRFGITEFTSVANAGTASALGAGSVIQADNSSSAAILRHVGSNNSSTDRAIQWSASTGALTLESSGSGTVSFLSSTALVTADGSKTLGLGGSNTGDNTFAQAIQDGPASGVTSLQKSGAGKWILTGTHSYSGTTTVGAGILEVDGSAAGSAFTVSGSGTLKGSGTIGALTVSTGGTVNPGNSPGMLTTGNLSINGGTYLAEIASDSSYDQLNVAGTVSLNGVLSLSLGYTPTEGDLFFLILNDGVDSVSSTFTGLAEGAIFTSGSDRFQITYLADSGTSNFTGGNDVALIAVPEVSACWLALIGFGCLVRRQRP